MVTTNRTIYRSRNESNCSLLRSLSNADTLAKITDSSAEPGQAVPVISAITADVINTIRAKIVIIVWAPGFQAAAVTVSCTFTAQAICARYVPGRLFIFITRTSVQTRSGSASELIRVKQIIARFTRGAVCILIARPAEPFIAPVRIECHSLIIGVNTAVTILTVYVALATTISRTGSFVAKVSDAFRVKNTWLSYRFQPVVSAVSSQRARLFGVVALL